MRAAAGRDLGVLGRAWLLSWPLLLGLPACSAPAGLPHGRWVDLTHDFAEDTVYWPTSGTFVLKKEAEGVTDQGYWYAANSFCTSEHGGTHVDAPVHFAQGRRTLEQIPIGQLIGPAVVIDVSAAAQGGHDDSVRVDRSEEHADRDWTVRIEDLLAWESRHGRIPLESIVLLRTGYGDFWPDRVRYLGTDERGAEGVAALHFPGLSSEAALWLLEARSIKAVGIDTASIDRGTSHLYETHQMLSAANVPAFENVAGLEQLPPVGAFVFALPMKIRGGTGGPLRIVALVPEGD